VVKMIFSIFCVVFLVLQMQLVLLRCACELAQAAFAETLRPIISFLIRMDLFLGGCVRACRRTPKIIEASRTPYLDAACADHLYSFLFVMVSCT
jgi:hypothetical protein